MYINFFFKIGRPELESSAVKDSNTMDNKLQDSKPVLLEASALGVGSSDGHSARNQDEVLANSASGAVDSSANAARQEEPVFQVRQILCRRHRYR
jgi:hypothetical protein